MSERGRFVDPTIDVTFTIDGFSRLVAAWRIIWSGEITLVVPLSQVSVNGESADG